MEDEKPAGFDAVRYLPRFPLKSFHFGLSAAETETLSAAAHRHITRHFEHGDRALKKLLKGTFDQADCEDMTWFVEARTINIMEFAYAFGKVQGIRLACAVTSEPMEDDL
jgi:hypothetical protein